jgi:hypothetical protein
VSCCLSGTADLASPLGGGLAGGLGLACRRRRVVGITPGGVQPGTQVSRLLKILGFHCSRLFITQALDGT